MNTTAWKADTLQLLALESRNATLIAVLMAEVCSWLRQTAGTTTGAGALCHLIALMGFDGVRAVLDLNSSEVAACWPEIRLTSNERKVLRKRVGEHYDTCERCQGLTTAHRRLDRALDRSIRRGGSGVEMDCRPTLEPEIHSAAQVSRR